MLKAQKNKNKISLFRQKRTTIKNLIMLSTRRSLLFTAILIIQGGEAFFVSKSPRRRFRTHLSSNNGNIGDINDADNNDGTSSYWRLPNDFSLFLTQRSIQSFMFLTNQLRDPETAFWVESFTQPNLVVSGNEKSKFSLSEVMPDLNDIGRTNSPSTNKEEKEEIRTCHLLRYHGLAAMDTTRFPTWDNYFEKLLEEPKESWIIQGHQAHIPAYSWDIDPSSLCSRILSVREQLSREFANDLQVVSDMGGQTLQWYWERVKNMDKSSSLSSLKGSRDYFLFLEINVDDPQSDHKPSPLRRGNFDLLILLATEEAIHRVLNRWELKKSTGELRGSEFVCHGFLENFYQDKQHLFHGPVPYGKTDDILEELLSSSLSFKNIPENGGENGNDGTSSSVIDPTQIAELILREREQVALEWKEIASEAPQYHMKIQKLRLDRMMMGNKGQAEETRESSSGGGGIFE